jgi:hypothetical protein
MLRATLPLIFVLVCACASQVLSQSDKIVRLTNPSFEESQNDDAGKKEWKDCGFDTESPPDFQPGLFNCDVEALHGDTYLGMVTRDDNTWERVCQELPQSLLRDTTYWFSLCLAASPTYVSRTSSSSKPLNFDAPVKLRIWGSNHAAKKEVLLAESPAVSHHQWMRYTFELNCPKFEVDRITLEAYYADDPKKPTRGNLLIDNCSDLFPASLRAEFRRSVRDASEQVGSPDSFALKNPSFEGKIVSHAPASRWIDMGDDFYNAYRIHPAHGRESAERVSPGPNTVSQDIFLRKYDAPSMSMPKPSQGRRYNSLVASSKNLRQAIGQSLLFPLKMAESYSFSLDMAKSKHFYATTSWQTNDKVDYKNPLRLRIWGGSAAQSRTEILAESSLVTEADWKKFEFVLKPTQSDCTVLILEAAYVAPDSKPYNGHLLLDNCSAIVRIRE